MVWGRGVAFDLGIWIEGQLRHRWACCERVILRQGYLCQANQVEVIALDGLVEASSCVEVL